MFNVSLKNDNICGLAQFSIYTIDLVQLFAYVSKWANSHFAWVCPLELQEEAVSEKTQRSYS